MKPDFYDIDSTDDEMLCALLRAATLLANVAEVGRRGFLVTEHFVYVEKIQAICQRVLTR